MADGGLVLVSTSPVPAEMFAGSLPEGSRALRAESEDELLALAPEADIIVGDWSHRIHIRREALAAAVKCRLVQQPTAGYEHIDIEAAADLGIPVANAGDANASAVAEHAIMLLLGCIKQLRGQVADAEAGGWVQQRWIDKDLGDLGQATVGILGLGAIGKAIAVRLRGFGTKVLYNKRAQLDAATEAELGVEFAPVEALLSRCDALVVTLPLNSETRGMIGAAEIARMPAGAILVNVARGPIVAEDAMVAALESGKLGGAGLDVYDVEPLPPGHRLAGLPNVLLTPHVGGATAHSKRMIMINSFANIGRVVRGEDPEFVVNRVAARRG